jgi:hypothetical protein
MKQYDDIYIDSLSIDDAISGLFTALKRSIETVGEAFCIGTLHTRETKNGEILLKDSFNELDKVVKFRIGITKKIATGEKPHEDPVFMFFDVTSQFTIPKFLYYQKTILNSPNFDDNDKSSMTRYAQVLKEEIDKLNACFGCLKRWPEFASLGVL